MMFPTAPGVPASSPAWGITPDAIVPGGRHLDDAVGEGLDLGWALVVGRLEFADIPSNSMLNCGVVICATTGGELGRSHANREVAIALPGAILDLTPGRDLLNANSLRRAG